MNLMNSRIWFDIFNPNMKNTTDSINNSLDDMKYINDNMRRQIDDLQDDADEMKDSGAINTEDGMVQYITINMTVKGLKTAADSMSRSLEYMNRSDSSIKSNITYASEKLHVLCKPDYDRL